MADIKGWAQYMGAQWCGEGSDIERCLEHSNQAVRYLISGKDDCVRKACKVLQPSLLAMSCCGTYAEQPITHGSSNVECLYTMKRMWFACTPWNAVTEAGDMATDGERPLIVEHKAQVLQDSLGCEICKKR